VGHHIAFAAGEFAPDTTRGRRLLSHELAHVLQQTEGGSEHKLRRQPEESRELNEQDEKNCSPLYLQKLCVEIIGGFQGDRSGVETSEEMAGYNAACRQESGWTGKDVELSTNERLALRTPKCPRGDPAKAKASARSARVSDALNRSIKYMPAGIGQEVANLVTDPVFIGSLVLAIGIYLALWLAPEPIFTKIAAAATTIAILSTGVFAVSTILHLGEAWLDLDMEAGDAASDAEIERAAEKFGRRMGAVEADLIVFLASLLVGGKLPTPKGTPNAAAALADAERAMASAQEGGTVIKGPWGRARATSAGGGEPTVGATRGALALKVEPSAPPIEDVPPQSGVRPAQAAQPGTAPAPGKASAPGKAPVPVPLAPGTKREKPPEPTSMRHQIQRGKDHHSSRAVTADGRVGVTAVQLRTTMAENLALYMSIARGDQPPPPGWAQGPVSWEPALRSAIIKQSQAITAIVAAGGVTQGGDINSLRQCFNPRTLAPSGCESDDVRLDVENRGHNLRS
jgi:hypothetical protein